MNKKFDAVIFDLDGTLVDSIPDIADSMNRVLSREGFPEYSYDQYKYFVGNGIKQLVEKSIPEHLRNNSNIENLFNLMMEEYGNNYLHKTHLYAGIAELLDFLSLKKIKISILSNKTDSITQKICADLFKQWNFEIILGATDKYPKKPDPQAALFIADFMSVAPENILYLGDTNVDMQTARYAGFYPVGAAWGFRTKEELAESGAKFIANLPSDCTKFFY